MKQCPKCSRVYADDSLNFCLDDGEWLLSDSKDEAPTAIISGSESNAGQPTQTLPGSGESTVIQSPGGNLSGVVSRNKTLIFIAVGILILAGLVFGLVKFYRPHISSASNAPLKVTPLTSSPGIERDPAFSPDGKQVAFVWTGENDDNFDIYVKIIGAGEPVRLTTDSARDMSPAWSPDGRYIAFVRGTTEKKGVYIVPAFPGAERRITDVYEWKQNGTRPQSLKWSPDGKTLVLLDKASEDDPQSIYLVSVDTGERTRLTQPPAGYLDEYLSLSPDGSHVAFVRSQNTSGHIYTVPTAGGEPTMITSDEDAILGLAWTSDGSELLYSSGRGGANPTLWRVPATGGESVPVAGAGDNIHEISVSSQGDKIAYGRADTDTNIYRFEMPIGARASSRVEAPASFISSTRNEQSPVYSPDGRRIAFWSDRSGGDDIWTCDPDGKNLVQVTNLSKVHLLGPSWSPDSRFIAFAAHVGGNEDIYVVGADGGSPRRLTNDPAAALAPSWSRDGRWIYFTSKRTGRSEVWKMPSAGGDAVQLTHGGGANPQASPDGRTIYYLKGELQTRVRSEPGLWQVSADGGEETRLFDLRVDGGNWTLSQRGIYFFTPVFEQQKYVLEFFNFATRQTSQIKTIDSPRSTFLMSGMTVSPDEKWVAYGQRDKLSFDLMLVENFH